VRQRDRRVLRQAEHGSPVKPGISVVIPTHPGREPYLKLAVESAWAQRRMPRLVHVVEDLEHNGAAITRDRGLRKVETEWVAFLDSDDVMYPDHLSTLLAGAKVHGADYVYSWYEIINRHGTVVHVKDPLEHFGKPFDPDRPTQTTVTTLVRTELAQSVGFDAPVAGETVGGQVAGEDWRFTLGCLAAGAKVVHVPKVTWGWRHHGIGSPGHAGNTSGLGSRW